MKQKYFLLIILNFLFYNNTYCQTWNGNTSTDWNTASNWSPATIPLSTSTVIIPGSLSKYPVLDTDVSIKSLDMQSGSQLDFKGHNLTIKSTAVSNFIKGAVLNNSDGSSDIEINIYSTGNGFSSNINSSIVNDNITFNLSGTNSFSDADGNGSANTYNGNVIVNAKDELPLNISNGSASQFNGDITIARTVKGGISTLFGAGGNITGSFKFTNNLDGALLLGNLSKSTNISGKIDIVLNQATPALFEMYSLKNQTPGGNIIAQNTLGFYVRYNILKVNSFSVIGYRGEKYKNFYNNDLTGDLILVDVITDDGGYSTGLRSNVIRGNADFTIKGDNSFDESDFSNSGNNFIGNVNYTITGTASVTIGDYPSTYSGNLTINRTGSGSTQGFASGGEIGGNFIFTNNADGYVQFGSYTNSTTIKGKIDIMIDNTTSSEFLFQRMVNETTGGNIEVKNTLGFEVRSDTLKVSSFKITGYRGQYNSYFYNNDITGNLTLADDMSYADFKGTYLRSNTIRGNSAFFNNGSNKIYDADVAKSANHFIGNVSFTATNKGSLYLSSADASIYDGDLSINRSGLGDTEAFNSGGTIGGNFFFTATAVDETLIGNKNFPTRIAGKVNIDINITVYGNYFQFYRVINQTEGGVINIKKYAEIDFQMDTLKVDSIVISDYNYGLIYKNEIDGNIKLTDNTNTAYRFITRVRSNMIKGNASFYNTGSNFFYDGDEANSGNFYTGSVLYNKNINGNPFPGEFLVGTGDTTSIGEGLTVNTSFVTLSKIQFTGNFDGNLKQSENMTMIIPTMIMNKGGKAKITLMDTLKVTGSLNLVSGIIESGVNSNLVLPDNITYEGGSDSSYVDGPMLKIGDDAFTFPVGKENFYAPLSITAPQKVTDQFRAQYLPVKPNDAGYDASKKENELDHISGSEYWLLDRTGGNSNVFVTLSWSDKRSGVVNDLTALRVARWDGNTWKNLGKGTTTGNNANGTIQTDAAVSSFSPFTLASTSALNPLPISISRFDATKKKQSVSLNWTTENEINFSHFEVERADGNNHFSSIGKVSAHNSQAMQYYSFEDNQPLKGVNLYRLKLVGADGKVVYSDVKSILFNANGTITVYPNPAIDFIQIDGVKEGVTIEIQNAGGKLVKRILSNASNRYSVSDLGKGMYFIKIIDKEITTVNKLIIQ